MGLATRTPFSAAMRNSVFAVRRAMAKSPRVRAVETVGTEGDAHFVRLTENKLQNSVFLHRKALKRIDHNGIAGKKIVLGKNVFHPRQIVERVDVALRNKRIIGGKNQRDLFRFPFQRAAAEQRSRPSPAPPA